MPTAPVEKELEDIKEKIELLEHKKRLAELEREIDEQVNSSTKEEDTTSKQNKELIPAHSDRRLINLFVDLIALYCIAYGTGYLIAALNPRAVIYAYLAGDDMFWYVISTILAVAYYWILEATGGRTLGKILTGTIVVQRNGKKPTFSQIFGRSLARLIPFEILSFFGTRPVGWHDSLSGTMVVTVKENPQLSQR